MAELTGAQKAAQSIRQAFSAPLGESVFARKEAPLPAPPMPPANPWVGVAQQAAAPVDPREAILRGAARQMVQQSGVTEPPTSAALAPALMEAAAARLKESGATGSDAKLQALAAEGSPWAKAQLAKRQMK